MNGDRESCEQRVAQMDRIWLAVLTVVLLIGLEPPIRASAADQNAGGQDGHADDSSKPAVPAEKDAGDAAGPDLGAILEGLGKAAKQGAVTAAEVTLRALHQSGDRRPAPGSMASAVRQRAISTLRRADRLDEIIASLEKDYHAAAQGPKAVSLADALAELYEAKGDHDRAAEMYDKILGHLPRDPQANFRLSGRYHQQKLYPRMLAALSIVWETNPEWILRETPRIGRYYADAKQGHSLIRRIERLNDAKLLDTYGDRLVYVAHGFSRNREQTEMALRTYAAILKVLPVRLRSGPAREYGDLLKRHSRLPEAYDVYKLGFFPAPSKANGGAFVVPEQRSVSRFQTGEVVSPMIALADLAESMQALDRLEKETRASLEEAPVWKATGELFLAMLSRRRGDERPITDLGSQYAAKPDSRAAMASVVHVLRQELSQCGRAKPLAAAKSLWQELADERDDHQVEAALHQLALIELRTGARDQARQLWLKVADRPDKAKQAIEQDMQSRSFVARQLFSYGFPVDALRQVRQILETDRSGLSANSYASYMIKRVERDLLEALQTIRPGAIQLTDKESDEVLGMLLGLLFKDDAGKGTEFGSGLQETTVSSIAEFLIAFAKTAGQLGRLRQQWDAHPIADSPGLLALRAEAAMADGDQQGAGQLLAKIDELEKKTGTAAPLWSPACLFHGLDQRLTAEFRDDLRGAELNRRVFTVMPAGLRQHVQPESRGLRIHTPSSAATLSVLFTPILRGDFEVTASYSIPEAKRPDQIAGNANLRVWSSNGKRQLAAFFSVNGLPADQGGHYVMNRGHIEGKKHDIRTELVPTGARSGKLRVVRKGATLHFLAAEGRSHEFRRLHQIPFSSEDIIGTRLGVHTVDPAIGMEVRWTDLVIRAEQVVGEVDAVQSTQLASGLKLELPVEYTHDFRDSHLDDHTLELVGGGASHIIRAESEGLRMRAPTSSVGKLPAVGVSPRFRIRGDFEVTVTYEILNAARPPKEGISRTRFQIEATLDSSAQESLRFSLSRATAGDFEYYTTRRIVVDDKDRYPGRVLPTNNETGKMRLVRTGRMVHFFVSNGEEDVFEILHQMECGDEEVASLTMWILPGIIRANLDLRLTDLTIRAEELPGWTGPPPMQRRWLWWLVGLFALLLSGAGIWWVVRSEKIRSG